MTRCSRGSRPPGDRRAFSLLEVLVACGILVTALASIAAILPAAGSRLGEAASYDRAAATMDLAFTEIQCRGLASRAVYSSTASTAAILIGETLPLAVLTSSTASFYPASVTTTGTVLGTGTLSISGTAILSASGTGLSARIANNLDDLDRRGYFLEDEVQYLAPAAGGLPMNSFTGATLSGTGVGPRQFRRGACWGAMIKPSPWGGSVGAATALDVSVAVFRKPARVVSGTTNVPVVAMTLTGTDASGIFRLAGTNTPASLQRRFLRPCGHVLALPLPAVSGSVSPRWLSVRSSWIAGGAPLTTLSTATTCVVFEHPSAVQPILGTSGTAVTVIGFEDLLDVQERTFVVE